MIVKLKQYFEESARYLKKNFFIILLLVLMFFMCYFYAKSEGMTADFNALNGDFQNYNPVRRLLDGQLPFKDFVEYLGLGHALIGLVMVKVFGMGEQSISISKAAFCAATLLSFCLITYTLLHAILAKRNQGKLYAMVLTSLFLFVILTNSSMIQGFLNARVNELYTAMLYGKYAGNSARFIRGAAMFAYVCIFSIFAHIFKRIMDRKHVKLSIENLLNDNKQYFALTILTGVVSGIIIYYSNDYGIGSFVSATVILLAIILFNKDETVAQKLLQILLYLVCAGITFFIFGTIITGFDIFSYIKSTVGTGAFQRWYYLSGKSYYLWDIDFKETLQGVITFLYLVKLIMDIRKNKATYRIVVPLFFNMTAYAVVNEYKLLSGGYLHEVSYTVLTVTIIAELFNWVVSRSLFQNEVFTKILYSVAFLCCTANIYQRYYIYQNEATNVKNWAYVENLGYFENTDMATSIQSTDEFMSDDAVVFSTYATGVEAYRNQFQPSGTDYIIHVLGEDAREKYLKAFKNGSFEYVSTIREEYSGWEYWVRNANWFFYRELYDDYEPVYASGYQMFWKKKSKASFINSDEYLKNASVNVETINEKSIRITVEIPGMKYGIADINLNYMLKKESSLKSFFTFQTMVLIQNTSAYQLSENGLDSMYYLPSESNNMQIGIAVIDGVGSIVLTSEPEENTYFDYFDASMANVYTDGYFRSVVVNAIDTANGYPILFVDNTNRSRLIVQDGTSIILDNHKYGAVFKVSEDQATIEIHLTEQLNENDLEILTKSSYKNVIKVV